MVMPRLAAIILNRSQIGSSTMIAVLLLGLKGGKLFERFLRQDKLCRSCFNGKRGPSITLNTSHTTNSSYLPRCNFAPPASAIQLYAIGRGSVSRCSAGGRGRIASRNC